MFQRPSDKNYSSVLLPLNPKPILSLTLRLSALSLVAAALSACVAGPGGDSSSSEISSETIVSSQTTVSSEQSSVVMVSSESSSDSSSSESSSSDSSSSESSSSATAPSSISSVDSSEALPSSSSEASLSSESSSSEAGPPMVSCNLDADVSDQNRFVVNSFQIINSDSRPVENWTISLTFPQGNINGHEGKVYADPEKQIELGTVTRSGGSTSFTIEGGMINPMSTLDIYGFTILPSGVTSVPVCELDVVVERYDPTGYVGVDQEELDSYFADYPCGVGYTAIGNGGWGACFVTDDNQAACATNGMVTVLKWRDGSPLDNVAQVSGYGDGLSIIVTTDGAAYTAKNDQGVDPIMGQVVASGAITASGGYTPRGCIMIQAEGKRDLICTDKGDKWERPNVPEDFDVVQLSSSYKMNCALNTKGEVWCWGKIDSISEILSETPAKIPFNEPMMSISADQTTICGVSYFGNSKCFASDTVPGYTSRGDRLKGTNNVFMLPEGFEPNAAFFHGAYNKGVVIRKDGTAAYYTVALSNSGSPVEIAVDNVIAAGGKRDHVSVLSASGQVYGVKDGNAKLIEGYTAKMVSCPITM